MSKEKRRGEPNANSGKSTESSGEYRNSPECVHINKSVDLTELKKCISKNSLLVECKDCKKCSLPKIPTENGLYELDLSLWMCLKCGNLACGRTKNKHALQHYNKHHSDSHSLSLNMSTWSVWCYLCHDWVNVTSKKKLLECVEYLKKCSKGVIKWHKSLTIEDKEDDMANRQRNEEIQSYLEKEAYTNLKELVNVLKHNNSLLLAKIQRLEEENIRLRTKKPLEKPGGLDQSKLHPQCPCQKCNEVGLNCRRVQ